MSYENDRRGFGKVKGHTFSKYYLLSDSLKLLKWSHIIQYINQYQKNQNFHQCWLQNLLTEFSCKTVLMFLLTPIPCRSPPDPLFYQFSDKYFAKYLVLSPWVIGAYCNYTAIATQIRSLLSDSSLIRNKNILRI